MGTVDTRSATKGDLITRITGRVLEEAPASTPAVAARGRSMSVRELRAPRVEGLTFSVRAGECLGITGLIGSGFELVPQLLFGGVHADGGTLELRGKTYDLRSLTPSLAVKLGIGLIPGDRQHDGVVGDLTLHENITLLDLPKYFRHGYLHRRAMAKDTLQLLGQFDVRPREPSRIAATLSGGNQQKAVLAKWIHRRPHVLLCHEPTQGVDVGARREIHVLLDQLKAEGTAILCAGADHEELAAICDRVLVIRAGALVAELRQPAVRKETITELCLAQ
jgi:ribose transport system ATP-binding protein